MSILRCSRSAQETRLPCKGGKVIDRRVGCPANKVGVRGRANALSLLRFVADSTGYSVPTRAKCDNSGEGEDTPSSDALAWVIGSRFVGDDIVVMREGLTEADVADNAEE